MSLQTIATLAGRQLEDASAQEILRWAAEEFTDRLCVTSSMTDAVVVHLAATVAPGIDVLFLDTGYHFAETLGTRDAVAATYDVHVVNVVPRQTVAEQEAEHGRDLFARDPDRCCALRKVAPLEEALGGYDAWATGLRREESPTRADTAVVAWDDRRGKVRISPIARWTQDDVDAYIAEHQVLVNPLVSEGYPSIGCRPCTSPVAAGTDPRSGRWSGLSKTECGIHG